MTQPTFKQLVKQAVDRKCNGVIQRASTEIGIENTVLWYFLKQKRSGISLRTFALICLWAGIDANEVLEEFTV